MKPWIAVVGLLCVLYPAGPAQGADSAPVLRVAVDADYPPFSSHDAEGRLVGFDVDLTQALCKELKRRCVIRAMPLDSIIPAMEAGDIDMAVASMAVCEKRKKKVDFTDKYYRSLSIFVERAGTVREFSPAGLRGLRVGAQKGTLQAAYLEKHYGESIRMVRADSSDALFALLREGSVDVVLVDGLLGYTYLKSEDGLGLETVGDALTADKIPDWASIAVSKKQPQLREALNKAIQTLRRNGEYGKINRKYFEFNIY